MLTTLRLDYRLRFKVNASSQARVHNVHSKRIHSHNRLAELNVFYNCLNFNQIFKKKFVEIKQTDKVENFLQFLN